MDLAIALDSNAAVPLHRQLYEETASGNLNGRLLTQQRIHQQAWQKSLRDFSHGDA